MQQTLFAHMTGVSKDRMHWATLDMQLHQRRGERRTEKEKEKRREREREKERKARMRHRKSERERKSILEVSFCVQSFGFSLLDYISRDRKDAK